MRSVLWILVAALANTVAAASVPSQEQSIAGDWSGAIVVAGTELDIRVHFADDAGGMTATIDIPQQGASGVPLQGVTIEASRIHMELPAGAGMAVFDGEQKGDSIGGSFTQAGVAATFWLRRSEAEAATAPAPAPVPYREEEITFYNDGISFAGTLTLPPSGGPHPAVVMITGSGAQNRDEELFGFKPFRVIADHLTRNGIVVLRYDDRGIGGSSGSVDSATTADFAQDALAAIAFLQDHNDIDAGAVGLIGHSEGGIVAPLAASQSDDVAFTVLLAGPAITSEEILYLQGELIARANGASEDVIREQREGQERFFRAVRTGEGWEELEVDLRKQLTETLDTMNAEQRAAISDEEAFIDAQVQAQMRAVQTPWFRFFLDYDPVPALRGTSVPVLAIFGELDLQVPAEENAGTMREVFNASGHTDFTIETLPRANHLFLTAVTGSPSEYASMEKTFVPGLLPLITNWVISRTSR